MSEAVAVALISGGLAFAGVLVSNLVTHGKMQAELDKQIAIINTRLEELIREVREHNGFAKRLPVVERDIEVINHRIKDLEKGA